MVSYSRSEIKREALLYHLFGSLGVAALFCGLGRQFDFDYYQTLNFVY